MASMAAPPRRGRIGGAATPSPAVRPAGAGRHLAWLLGGMAVAFLVPFTVADQLALQRDIYLIVYVAAVVGLFLAWARDTGQSVREMFTRRWRLAVGLGIVCAGLGAVIATAAEGSSPHPGGIEFIGALLWRGIVYGAADGLLLSAFPILLVFAALADSRLRRGVGGLVAVGAVAMVASLAMTAVYHAGYSDFRGSKLRKPVTGDLVWSVPTLATLNPVGAPIAHVGVHIGAVVHNYDTDLFLPPHSALAVPATAAPVVPTLHLVDVERQDPFTPVRPRELMATVTYPARHAERYPHGVWFGRAQHGADRGPGQPRLCGRVDRSHLRGAGGRVPRRARGAPGARVRRRGSEGARVIYKRASTPAWPTSGRSNLTARSTLSAPISRRSSTFT